MRIFLAVEISESARDLLAKIVEQYKKMNLSVKWVKPENMHVTIKFLGDVDESNIDKIKKIAIEICQKTNRFEARLKGIGCFPQASNARIIWVGVDQGDAEFIALASAFENSFRLLGFKQENRFHPHITLGRVRKRCNIDEILKTEFNSSIFSVDSIILFQSTLTPTGPIYKVIERFALAVT